MQIIKTPDDNKFEIIRVYPSSFFEEKGEKFLDKFKLNDPRINELMKSPDGSQIAFAAKLIDVEFEMINEGEEKCLNLEKNQNSTSLSATPTLDGSTISLSGDLTTQSLKAIGRKKNKKKRIKKKKQR